MALIKGTNFGEKLYGTDSNDFIYGFNGNDIFYGSHGDDFINGGAGWDTVDYTAYGGRLSIVLNATGKSYLYGDGVLRDTLVSIEQIIGGSGDDYFVGNRYNNIISGGRGHDYFVANGGDDVYYGGAGYDMVDFTAIRCGLTFSVNACNGVTSVRYGNDVLDMTSMENVIGTRYADVIIGDRANNFFRGMGGNDRIWGGAGGDVLNGGAGNDILGGGADADIFEFKGRFGRDVVRDFDTTGGDHDFIDLSGVGTISDYDQMFDDNRIWQSGDDVYIDASRGDMIVLRNVSLADLSADHFLF